MICHRRQFLAAGPLALAAVGRTRAAEARTLRIGFQKGEPVLMAAKASRDLETLLEPKGIRVEWTEFQFGPPMLEAMRAGSIDVGSVGDTPPVFAQAARGDLLYIAAKRGSPQSILLPAGSKITTLADLKGKKLAFGRGSAAHHFVLLVLEKAGLTYDQIEPVYLGPADAGAAFQRGAIDGWSIWEPYASLFAEKPGVRTLTSNQEIGEQFGYFMGNGGFVRANPSLTALLVQMLTDAAARAQTHRDELAAVLTGSTGIAQDVWRRALSRNPLQVLPMSDAFARSQQTLADRFRALGLVPVPIRVADIVWRGGA